MKWHALALALLLVPATAMADEPSIRVELDASRRTLLRRKVNAFELDVAGGMKKWRYFVLRGAARATYGQTENGLHVGGLRGGCGLEFALWVLHAGVEGGVLAVGFRRATDHSWDLAPGLGIGAYVRFDLLPTPAGAFFIALRGDIAGARRWGANQGGEWKGYGVGIGFDFDLPRARPNQRPDQKPGLEMPP